MRTNKRIIKNNIDSIDKQFVIAKKLGEKVYLFLRGNSTNNKEESKEAKR